MIFKLEISRNNTNFFEVDLFPDPQLEYNVDFYDSLDINKIRLPFSSSMKIPMTVLNMSTSRFNYNPLVDTQDLFPKDLFFFKIIVYGSTEVNLQGLLNVQSFEYLSNEPYIDVNLDDYVSKYIGDLKDTTLSEVYDADTTSYGTYYRTDHTFQTFFFNAQGGGEQGVIGQNPDDKPIIFPYIDFCNDVNGKFGYAARQFTEYGTGMDRAGIVPVFSVKNFLTTLGYWISAEGFDTRVDSRLFGLNKVEAIPDFEAEKLQMLIPCKLEADVDTNTRDFFLRQAPFWTGTNENLYGKKDIDGNDKILVTNWFESGETFGNFGPFTQDPEDTSLTIPVTNQTQFGLDATNAAYPETEAFGNERGYFAPFMSYNAGISYKSGNTFANISEIKFEIPILQEDKLVYQLLPELPDSNMTFGIFIGVFENGEMVKKLRLEDSNGDAIVLNASDSTAVEGFSNKTDHTGQLDHQYFDDTFSSKYVIFDTDFTDVRDMLVWNLDDLGLNELHLPTEELEISGESRYGVNYFIEPIQGDLYSLNATNITAHGNSHYDANTIVTQIATATDIKKAITRTEEYGELNIKFLANANFNPYFTNDVYNIKDSLENTATLTPYQILVAICKRFNCGIYYEYDDVQNKNVLRIDPLHLMRSGSQSINDLVDDLKSVKVYLGGDKVKDLTINNKDYGLYFDDEYNKEITIGSTTQEINSDGVSDLLVDFKSSIYYKSVCGDALFQPENDNLINNIVSSKEVAFTPNLFTRHQEIGLRFAYVDKPLFSSMIKRPKVVNSEQKPNIFTITQRIYQDWTPQVFNGRLFHYNTQGWNLLAEDENGDTTDYYTFYTDNEKIKYSNRPTIEFNMVLQTSELASLDFFFKTLSSTRINQSDILVKSAEGEVFEDYAYLTIKGLLQ